MLYNHNFYRHFNANEVLRNTKNAMGADRERVKKRRKKAHQIPIMADNVSPRYFLFLLQYFSYFIYFFFLSLISLNHTSETNLLLVAAAPAGERASHNDEYLSVCLSVCLSLIMSANACPPSRATHSAAIQPAGQLAQLGAAVTVIGVDIAVGDWYLVFGAWCLVLGV